MDGDFKSHLRALHHVGWSGTWLWLVLLIAFLTGEGIVLALLLTGLQEMWQVAALAVAVLLVAHLMHAQLIAFHEAAHGLLCPVPWLNDAIGRLLAVPSFLSFELYRAAHHTHHAYLATERDEELWPFVLPGAPRWARRLAAFFELTSGLVYTPALFVRAFARPGTVIRNAVVRRRVKVEFTVLVVCWGLQLAAVAWWNLWPYWLALYLVPAWLAGCLQSLRKYVEHMGVAGAAPLSATRSVQSTSWAGRLVALTLLNEPLHGIHHKYPRLPQESLPALSPILGAGGADALPPFPNYRSALLDMLGSLRDPQVGRQWALRSTSDSDGIGNAKIQHPTHALTDL